MVSPGGSAPAPSASADPVAPAAGVLGQLTAHTATPVTLPGTAGELAALDTGGAGPTALLVPGFTGSKEDFAPLLTPLSAAGVRVVALDQRGQHESAGPDDPARYSIDELAGDLVAVGRRLRAEGSGPLHLLGHSFGGLVARAAVLAEPTLFDSLTLLDSGPSALTGPSTELIAHLSPLLDVGGTDLLAGTLGELWAAEPARAAVPPETTAFRLEVVRRSGPAALRGMSEALVGEPDRVAELAATGVPVLVAYGVDDDAWTPAVQADMAARLGARHEVIAPGRHSPAIENTDATVAVLLSAWAAVPVRRDEQTVGAQS
ncbi:alpha/beta fold hydrolase [Modestobacter sp. SSW1-42]|uniref:alpha/beta fold hydrolase n=1 Tax=Modestobacter sp. SSW1-42 TaxID=596372 RepID=UPI003986299D